MAASYAAAGIYFLNGKAVYSMISIPFLICILGLICWIVLSAPSPSHWVKPVLAKAAEWCFFWGLAWTLSVYAGKLVF